MPSALHGHASRLSLAGQGSDLRRARPRSGRCDRGSYGTGTVCLLNRHGASEALGLDLRTRVCSKWQRSKLQAATSLAGPICRNCRI